MPFRSRKTRWGLAALGALVAFALGGWANPPNILDPHGPEALKESNLFWFILVVATIIFVAVMSVLLYSIVRFRARPGMPVPRQLHGNNKLEIAWTVVPSIVLLLVLFMTISTMFSLAQPTGVPTMTVRAIGHQWWWEFQYPDQHIVTADELHVPTNMVVHVELYSNNVIHSFWIPQLSGKTDVIPGHDNTMWFSSDKTGVYRGECAEFCGTQHAHMNFEVVVDSPGVYATWLAGQQAPAAKPTSALALQGQQAFRQCSGCHYIQGVDPFSTTQIGPNLTHFGSRNLIAGGVLVNNKANLAMWLKDPQAVKSGSDMPNLGLTQAQIDALVAYLESLK